MMDLRRALGAEFREVRNCLLEGKPARVVVASRIYATDQDDLWDALTNAERIPRWFLPISGELELDGRYQLEGNAGGRITRCDKPEALDVTWEYAGNVSWVTVRLEPDGAETRLTLEHIMLNDEAGEEHWRQYGPAATGIGWDLSFLGMALHLESHGEALDREGIATWMASDEGKSFMHKCADAWGAAHIATGEEPDIAHAMATRTSEFYTGS